MLPAYLDSKAHLRSHREIKRVLENHVLPQLGDRLADTVTHGEITEFIDGIAATAPTMARAVHAQLSSFYSWAMPRLDLFMSRCRPTAQAEAARPGANGLRTDCALESRRCRADAVGACAQAVDADRGAKE